VVAMSMDASGRSEQGQSLEQLEGREAKLRATVHIELGEPVHQAGPRRGERPDAVWRVEPLQGERPARAVPNEPLESRSVMALDPDGVVDREAAGAPPDPPSACARHVGRSGGVQEPASREPAEDADLHRPGEFLLANRVEGGSLVEADPVLDVAGDHAIEVEAPGGWCGPPAPRPALNHASAGVVSQPDQSSGAELALTLPSGMGHYGARWRS
jgi:hypothetical protein